MFKILMVLETILTVEAIKKHPILMLLDTLIIATISLWVSYFVFPGSASILNIAFVSLALVPLIQKMFYVEETEEVSHPGRSVGFLSRHGQMLKIYAWFFIGLTLSYSFWYFFLPVTMEKSCVFGSVCFNIPTRDSVFKEQEATLSDIGSLSKSLTTGNATLNSSNNIDFFKIFEIIFSNN
ncbi:MAG: hypothetical protein Q7K42_02660, partial [Candidatus Diapherotrites archaeon]|nr:hypothetical protein [Candidatus Diapherotrites archaeon]